MMWIIHIVCVIFFLPALILTIPLHLILNAVKENKQPVKKTYGFLGNQSLFDQIRDPECKNKPWVPFIMFSGIFVISIITLIIGASS